MLGCQIGSNAFKHLYSQGKLSCCAHLRTYSVALNFSSPVKVLPKRRQNITAFTKFEKILKWFQRTIAARVVACSIVSLGSLDSPLKGCRVQFEFNSPCSPICSSEIVIPPFPVSAELSTPKHGSIRRW